MYLLLNWIKNKYFIFIIIILVLYVINLVICNAIAYTDYILIIYLLFIESGKRENILYLSIIAGLIIDIIYSPIIGLYLLIFILFFIGSEIYRNYVNFEKFYIRMFFYLSIVVIYINYSLLIYKYPLDVYILFNINRLSLDMFFTFFLFLIIKRLQRAV